MCVVFDLGLNYLARAHCTSELMYDQGCARLKLTFNHILLLEYTVICQSFAMLFFNINANGSINLTYCMCFSICYTCSLARYL